MFFNEIEINENFTKKNYEINYAEKKEEKIEIIFLNFPDENVHLMNENKEIQCEIKKLIMICEINNEILEVDKKNPEKFKNYKLKIIDGCGNEKFYLNVKVKNLKDKKILRIIFIIFSIIFLIFVLFFIYKIFKNKKEKDDINDLKENKLIS